MVEKMKNEQNNWVAWVAVIALVVAVLALAFVLKGGVTGNAINPANITIRANSCDKDSVCEVKSLYSTRGIKANSCNADGLCEIAKGDVNGSLVVNQSLQVGVGYPIGILTTISDGRVDTPKLRITHSNNTNNEPSWRYLCADVTGQVYLTPTPCA